MHSEFAADIEVDDDAEGAIRDLLGEDRLLAYHATRLLPHEIDMVEKQGLRTFSRSLFDDKIRAARAADALTASQADALAAGHHYAVGQEHNHGHRVDQVCVILGRRALDEDTAGLWPLMTTWGGEGIYFSPGTQKPHTQSLLRSLGQPAVVVVTVPILPLRARQLTAPSLPRAFLAASRGLERASCEIHHPEPIAPCAVLSVWTPGHPEYDRHEELPRR